MLRLPPRFAERLKNAAEALVLGSALDLLVGTVMAGRPMLRAQNAARRFRSAEVWTRPAEAQA